MSLFVLNTIFKKDCPGLNIFRFIIISYFQVYDSSNFSSKAFCISDIMNRELGWSGRTGHGTCNNLFSFNNNRSQNSASLLYDQAVQTPRHFIRRAMSSMSLARRMKLAQNLNYHEGCVNALNFNRIGTLLASGSDDYQVCLWDWTRNNLVLTFDSGHKSNVFQVSVFFCCNWVHF